MTEPDFAGSNPVNMGTTAEIKGDQYVINGHKWFTSGFDGAEFAIVMLVSNPKSDNPHKKSKSNYCSNKDEGSRIYKKCSNNGTFWRRMGKSLRN
jgi:alkylation response protein AidB-like acyl-CoA dehydrogenase